MNKGLIEEARQSATMSFAELDAVAHALADALEAAEQRIEELENAFMEMCNGLEDQLGPGTPTEWVERIERLRAVFEAAKKLHSFGIKRGSQAHLELEEALAAVEVDDET